MSVPNKFKIKLIDYLKFLLFELNLNRFTMSGSRLSFPEALELILITINQTYVFKVVGEMEKLSLCMVSFNLSGS